MAALGSFYDRHIGPRLVDCACGSGFVGRQRAKVVPHAEGRVLEIGFGSGRNLPFYDPGRVSALFALEPDPAMRRLARARLSASSIPVTWLDLSETEKIPLETDAADTIVVTYTLCTIPDVIGAVQEMRRVLKPGGRLLFAEHGLAPGQGVQRVQRGLEPLWRSLAGGCRLTRRPTAILEAGGFAVDAREGFPARAPLLSRIAPFATYQYWGEARPA